MKWDYESVLARIKARDAEPKGQPETVEPFEGFEGFEGSPLGYENPSKYSAYEHCSEKIESKEGTFKTLETLSAWYRTVEGWKGLDARDLPPPPPIDVRAPERGDPWDAWWSAVELNRRRHGMASPPVDE